MSNRRGALWAVLALFAIVLAAGLTWSVMRLAGQRIGLAAAPVSVVHGLAPGPGAGPATPPEHDVTRTVTVTVTVPPADSRSNSTPAATGTNSSPAGAVTPGVARTATSAVTITPPAGGRGATSRSGDSSEDARARSGGAPDD